MDIENLKEQFPEMATTETTPLQAFILQAGSDAVKRIAEHKKTMIAAGAKKENLVILIGTGLQYLDGITIEDLPVMYNYGLGYNDMMIVNNNFLREEFEKRTGHFKVKSWEEIYG